LQRVLEEALLALLEGDWLLLPSAILASLCGLLLLLRNGERSDRSTIDRETGAQFLAIAMLLFFLTTGARMLIAASTPAFPLSFFLDKVPLLLLVLAVLSPGARFRLRQAIPLSLGCLRGLGFGAVLYLLFLPGILLLHQWVMERQGDPDAVQESVKFFGQLLDQKSYTVLGSMAVALVVLVPLYEEILFRGLVQTGLMGTLGPRVGHGLAGSASLVFTAMVFMLLHEPFTWITVFALGIVLGLLRLRTSDLWAPLAFHVCHNAVTLLLTLWM
jgi:membrane protease YdiL (CAAX protease family)